MKKLTMEQLKALEFVFESATEYLETLEYDLETEEKLDIVKKLIQQEKAKG